MICVKYLPIFFLKNDVVVHIRAKVLAI